MQFLLLSVQQIQKMFIHNLLKNLEQSDIYLKLSNLTKNTGNAIVESMRVIEAGDDKTALNILSNVTINIEEIYNGLDILEDVTIKGGD